MDSNFIKGKDRFDKFHNSFGQQMLGAAFWRGQNGQKLAEKHAMGNDIQIGKKNES